ncbi:hypothetical protein OFB94_28985, partial [Escherichia coli]|nr:hypothetical protein [Escherichia coli]
PAPHADALAALKLTSTASLANMHVLGLDGAVVRLAGPRDAVRLFAPVRAALYAARRVRALAHGEYDLLRAQAAARLLEEVLAGSRRLAGKS